MNITYSEDLVALVRNLDRAEVSVRAANWFFSNTEMDDPEQFNGAGGFHAWVWGNIQNLEKSLPELRALFLKRVRAESGLLKIEAGVTGDAQPPAEVIAAIEPVIKAVLHVSLNSEPPHEVLELPNAVVERCGKNRLIFFDGEVFIIPPEISDSFVEVWFRRYFAWSDGSAYPMYLVNWPYGWQAYGIER